MASEANAQARGLKTGLLLAGCVAVLALPSAVMAFSASLISDPARSSPIDVLDPEASPDNLLRAIAMRSLAKGQSFPFTPAGTPDRPARSVTVAVRVDPEAAKAIIVYGRSRIGEPAAEPGRMRIAPTAFNLGVSRGYQNFAPDISPQTVGKGLTEAPDLKKFSLAPSTSANEPRFNTRFSIDEKRAPGRTPRTFGGDAGEVDLSGAYRVTKNLDVTAGVRYSQDSERLMPLTDRRQDSQAVYVGTQFHF